MRTTKADKIIDARIQRAVCNIPIPIMKLSDVSAFAKTKIAEGLDDVALAASIRAYVEAF